MMSTGALLCLLLWLNGLVLGEISENFSKCLNFFFNDTPPTNQNTSRYVSATRTSTILPACMTLSTAYRCTLPTYSVLQMAQGLRTNGCTNHRHDYLIFVLQNIYIFIFYIKALLTHTYKNTKHTYI